jgi:hypothetical protein
VQKRPVPRRVGKRVVSSANIKKDAVTPVELAPDSVTPEALAPDSVTQDAIAPGAVSDTELALGAGGADTTFSGSQPVNPAVGDVWFDSSDSLKLKRYDGTNWVSMRDLGIAAAQAGADAASTAAAAAQTTADGKNKVYRQTAEPTGGTYAEGDLWFDTDDNNKIYRRTSSAWTAVQLGGEALANINANKITAGTIDASVITVSNLNAGNLTAGTIAAARITSTSISAADINADRLTAGTIASARITSTSISAADINADRITVGTLTGRDINLLSGANGLYLNNGGAIDARYGTARILVNNADQLYPFVSYDTANAAAQAKIGVFFVCVDGAGNFTLSDSSGFSHIFNTATGQSSNLIGDHGAWFGSTYNVGQANTTFSTSRRDGSNIISARANGFVEMPLLPATTAGVTLRISGGYLYSTSSTRAIKENIEYFDEDASVAATDVLNKLRPVKFTVKRDEMDTDYTYALKQLSVEAGFIIEDIEEVQGEIDVSLLSYESTDRLRFTDGDRTPFSLEEDFESIKPAMYKENAILSLAVRAIQELTARVEELESRIS